MLKHFEWIHLIVFELEKMEDEGHDSFLAVGASSASVSNSCREFQSPRWRFVSPKKHWKSSPREEFMDLGSVQISQKR